jgi:hypothetical protein
MKLNIRKKIQGNGEMVDGLEFLLVLINALTSPVKGFMNLCALIASPHAFKATHMICLAQGHPRNTNRTQ